MRPYALAFAILLAAAALAQVSITQPKLVKTLDSQITESGKITALNGDLLRIELNHTIPQNTEYQTAQYAGPKVTDRDGNAYAFLSQASPPNPFEYSVNSIVQTRERLTTTLPAEYDVPQEYAPYLQQSPRVVLDPAIRKLAQEITANATSDWERVALLTIFAHDYIKYDFSLVGAKEDSAWVLANKRGVCVEYSSLFNALARSLGLPSRYVLGQAYGDYGWLGHSWNEVYIGRWVPTDPTWLEAGHLDATHIDFYRSVEPDANSKVVARVSEGAKLKWDKAEFAGENSSEIVHATKAGYNTEVDAYALDIAAKELRPGADTVAWAKVSGSDYRVIDAKLVECRGEQPVVAVDRPDARLVLEPGATRVAYWVVHASPGLNPNIIYTCPLTLNSGYLADRPVNLKISSDAKPQAVTATALKPVIEKGERQTIIVDLGRTGGTAGIILEDGVSTADASSTRLQFSFVPTRPGKNTVVAFSSLGGVAEASFEVVTVSDVKIASLEAPEYVKAGTPWSVRVTVQNLRSEPANADLMLSIGNYLERKRIVAQGTQSFDFQPPLEPGQYIGVATIDAQGSRDEERFPVTIYTPPAVKLKGGEFERLDGSVNATLTFTTTGEAVEKTLVILGQEVPFTGDEVTLQLRPGKYSVTIKWKDPEGAQYSAEETLLVPEKKSLAEVFGEQLSFLLVILVIVTIFWIMLAAYWLLKKRE
jgi:transglutaminase-like putative cysteine protease